MARPLLAALAALSALVPLVLAAGLAGLPLRPWAIALLAAGLAGVAVALRRSPAPGAAAPAWPEEPRSLVWFSRAVLAAVAVAFAWKVAALPLWSWDHFAIWGIKARRMLPDGYLDLAFLRTLELHDSRPDYPLGLPLLWRVLALGGMPGAAGIQAIHALFGLGTLLLLRHGLRRAGARESLANTLAAWGAALPLFWDTEAVGLAEMPLALWTVAAAGLLLRPPRRGDAVSLGLLLGFLPWLKDEGLPLAVLLAGAWFLLLPRAARRPVLAPMAGAALLLVAAAQAVAARELAAGVGFFAWRPLDRLAERLPQAGALLAEMLRRLLIPEALGFWVVLAVALLWAAGRRNRPALALGGVVLLQLGLYAATPFFTYLPPLDHLNAAFTRITAGLMPLGLLAIGLSLSPVLHCRE